MAHHDFMILLVVVACLALLPVWPYSRTWNPHLTQVLVVIMGCMLSFLIWSYI